MGVLSFLARRPLSAGVPLVLVTHLLAAAAGALFWHAAPRLAIDIPFTDSELVIFEGGSGARLASAAEDLRTRTTERDEARRSRDQWQASYRQSETNRSAERQRAADRIASLEADHAIELEAARQAAANAVRIIYREPEFDDTNCPLRSMFGNDELRDAIGAI
ncbi:Uncharacterized protein SCF082_LOCUS30378, partial [Durusdinium trenchii]